MLPDRRARQRRQLHRKKYLVTDKHGLTRNAYNAKINIYRGNSDPIYLGVQDHQLGSFAEAVDGLDIVMEDA